MTAIAFPTTAATSEGAGALRARRLATCPWPFAHYDQFSPFGTTSPTHLAKQPADDQTVSPSDTLANPWLDASNAAGQLGATWRQDSVQWPSYTSSSESPDRSPQQAHSSALPPQRSSGGSSPTTATLEEATAAMMLAASSPSASFTAYNMLQPSVGFYRRESASGMVPALTLVARPDHVSDTAGFNMNKSITKRMANATHYQQVCGRSVGADMATHFARLITYCRYDTCTYPGKTLQPGTDTHQRTYAACVPGRGLISPPVASCRSWRSSPRVHPALMRCAPLWGALKRCACETCTLSKHMVQAHVSHGTSSLPTDLLQQTACLHSGWICGLELLCALCALLRTWVFARGLAVAKQSPTVCGRSTWPPRCTAWRSCTPCTRPARRQPSSTARNSGCCSATFSGCCRTLRCAACGAQRLVYPQLDIDAVLRHHLQQVSEQACMVRVKP